MASGLHAREFLREARVLATEADPSVQLAPGWEAPFKLRLYNLSLDVLDQITADFNMLWVACVDQQSDDPDGEYTSDILEALAQNPTMRDLYERLNSHSKNMMDALFRTLRHTSETPLESDILEEVVSVSWRAVLPMEEREKLYSSLTAGLVVDSSEKLLATSLLNDRQARATVVIRALENAIQHLEDVASLIIGEDIF
mmetsp:Transcript_3156/g.5652  ORF Transcript_3156/g.5652 Transcript_3156/m.5652 type:complete len:199 (+) Transcript_3156:27-623(+)